MNACEVFAEMIPAKEIGGDFYDNFVIDETHTGFVIGDVSGKGIASAIFMAVCRSLLKATALQGWVPAECVSHVNRVLSEDNPDVMFVTLFYGILDLRNGEIKYSNGGHTFPYFVDEHGRVQLLKNPGGIVLWVVEDTDFILHSKILRPEELILLNTDGFLSPTAEEKDIQFDTFITEFLSLQRDRHPSDIVYTLFSEVTQCIGNNTIEDDLTGFIVQFKGN